MSGTLVQGGDGMRALRRSIAPAILHNPGNGRLARPSYIGRHDLIYLLRCRSTGVWTNRDVFPGYAVWSRVVQAASLAQCGARRCSTGAARRSSCANYALRARESHGEGPVCLEDYRATYAFTIAQASSHTGHVAPPTALYVPSRQHSKQDLAGRKRAAH